MYLEIKTTLKSSKLTVFYLYQMNSDKNDILTSREIENIRLSGLFKQLTKLQQVAVYKQNSGNMLNNLYPVLSKDSSYHHL